ncbi:MAG: hypothetical protein HFG27_09020 [Provencibacterium sp.]|nr:hypothetical protein [Provencibacterium sp.]
MNDYACIVDEHGSYVNYTALINGEPQFYELKEGEETVDVPPPPLRPHAGAHGFIRPCLENGCWAEAASPSEIEEWELLHPAPEPEAASPQDAALAQLMREVALLKIQGVKKDG